MASVVYRRRQPEKSVLHQIVQNNLATFVELDNRTCLSEPVYPDPLIVPSVAVLESRTQCPHPTGSRRRWFRSGAETLLMGGGAACVAYGVGVLLAGLA